MCKLKERSRRELCNVRNANGNLLDAAICEQVKHLADHSSDFMKQLEKAKSAHAGNRSEFETKLSTLRKEQAETQRKINALIDSLADFSDSTAAVHLKKRIEELNGQDAALSSRIRELESLTDEGVLAGMEFDLMRQLLTVFHDNIDDMTVTQKRAAIRTVVRKVVWDGKVAHVVLFGSPEDEIDWTTFPVDPEEDENDPEGGGDGSDSPSGVRSGEDSILNASAGIGRQLDIFFRIISIDRFDETDRSDGDQILNTDSRIIKFLCNVYDQSEIMLDQYLFCILFHICCKLADPFIFFFLRKRRWQHIRPSNIVHLPLSGEPEAAFSLQKSEL